MTCEVKQIQNFLLDLSKPLSSFVGVTTVLLQSTPTKLLQVSTLVIHNSFKMQNFHYILLSIEHLVQLFFHMIITTIFFYSNKQSCLSTCAETFMFKYTWESSHTHHSQTTQKANKTFTCKHTWAKRENSMAKKLAMTCMNLGPNSFGFEF
jgi:hypothetical protein